MVYTVSVYDCPTYTSTTCTVTGGSTNARCDHTWDDTIYITASNNAPDFYIEPIAVSEPKLPTPKQLAHRLTPKPRQMFVPKPMVHRLQYRG